MLSTARTRDAVFFVIFQQHNLNCDFNHHWQKMFIMIRDKLLEEMSRVDEQISDIDKQIKSRKVPEKDKKDLAIERKRLEKYRQELLREWRHLNL